MTNLIHSLLGSSVVLVDGAVDHQASKDAFEKALIDADQKALEKFEKSQVNDREAALLGFEAGVAAWVANRETWLPRIQEAVVAMFNRYAPNGGAILKPALLDRVMTHMMENGGVPADDSKKVSSLIDSFVKEESAKLDQYKNPLGLVHVTKGRSGGGVHLTKRD